jgi:hypothetical protein
MRGFKVAVFALLVIATCALVLAPAAQAGGSRPAAGYSARPIGVDAFFAPDFSMSYTPFRWFGFFYGGDGEDTGGGAPGKQPVSIMSSGRAGSLVPAHKAPRLLR